MKKYRLLLLLVAVTLIFSSCITKNDIAQMENELEEVEDNYDEIEEEYEDLDEEVSALKLELSAISDENQTISAQNDAAIEENDELLGEIPQPPFMFYSSTLDVYLLDVFEQENIRGNLLDPIDDFVYDREDFEDGIVEFVFELDGDIDSDEYLLFRYTTDNQYYFPYDIYVEYSGAEYEEDYNTMVQLVVTAIVYITEDYYYYDSEYWDMAEDAIEEGSYLYETIIISQEQDGDTGSTYIFCTN